MTASAVFGYEQRATLFNCQIENFKRVCSVRGGDPKSAVPKGVCVSARVAVSVQRVCVCCVCVRACANVIPFRTTGQSSHRRPPPPHSATIHHSPLVAWLQSEAFSEICKCEHYCAHNIINMKIITSARKRSLVCPSVTGFPIGNNRPRASTNVYLFTFDQRVYAYAYNTSQVYITLLHCERV